MVKNVKIYTCIFILVFFGTLTAYGQESDCKNRLKEYVQKMASASHIKKGTVVYMNMHIENVMGQESSAPKELNIKSYTTEGRMRYQSELVNTYMDSAETFVVLPLKQVVLHGNSGLAGWSSMDPQQLMTLQLAMLESCTFRGCYPVKENGKDYLMLDFEASDELKKEKEIYFLAYYLEKKSNNLYKVVVSYQPDAPVKRQIITYRQLDFDYKKEKVHPIRTYLYDAQGKILPAYKGYRLIDNRRTEN